MNIIFYKISFHTYYVASPPLENESKLLTAFPRYMNMLTLQRQHAGPFFKFNFIFRNVKEIF